WGPTWGIEGPIAALIDWYHVVRTVPASGVEGGGVVGGSVARQHDQTSRIEDHAPTVLVIDDDRDVADALVELLSWAGYQTTVAHSGAMALRLADEARPDVVLLDL